MRYNVEELPTNFDILRKASVESERRPVTIKSIDTLEYVPLDTESREMIVPPGTVTVFLARPGSRELRRIREVIENREPDEELFRQLAGMYEGRNQTSLDEALELLLSQDSFCDLIHGRSIVASNLFVPDDMPVVVVPLPYNGGALSPDGFTLMERTKPGITANLEGFAVRHVPELTVAEAEALQRLPAENNDFNVGRAAMCYAITGIVLVGAVMGATYACPGRYERPHLEEELVRSLGPAASAAEMLALRRQALEEHVG
jgi:hypothetical protein